MYSALKKNDAGISQKTNTQKTQNTSAHSKGVLSKSIKKGDALLAQRNWLYVRRIMYGGVQAQILSTRVKIMVGRNEEEARSSFGATAQLWTRGFPKRSRKGDNQKTPLRPALKKENCPSQEIQTELHLTTEKHTPSAAKNKTTSRAEELYVKSTDANAGKDQGKRESECY